MTGPTDEELAEIRRRWANNHWAWEYDDGSPQSDNGIAADWLTNAAHHDVTTLIAALRASRADTATLDQSRIELSEELDAERARAERYRALLERALAERAADVPPQYPACTTALGHVLYRDIAAALAEGDQ